MSGKKGGGAGGGGGTPRPSPNDNRANVKNPNNPAHQAAQDNRSVQVNPQPKPAR